MRIDGRRRASTGGCTSGCGGWTAEPRWRSRSTHATRTAPSPSTLPACAAWSTVADDSQRMQCMHCDRASYTRTYGVARIVARRNQRLTQCGSNSAVSLRACSSKRNCPTLACLSGCPPPGGGCSQTPGVLAARVNHNQQTLAPVAAPGTTASGDNA